MEKDTVQRCDTKKELIEAFWKLYAEKPVAKISVGSLCQLAGYNRTTFYNHFKDIYDLLEQASGDIFLTVRDEVLSENNFRDILSGNMIETIFLNGFVRQHEHIELLFKRHDYYILGEKVKKGIFIFVKKRIQLRRYRHASYGNSVRISNFRSFGSSKLLVPARQIHF